MSNHQRPANGLPKIPTASSTQTNNRITKVFPIKINLLFVVVNFFKIKLIVNAAPKSINPAIVKSNSDQLTSLENCMAINGILSNKTGTENRIVLLWFLVIIILNFNHKEL